MSLTTPVSRDRDAVLPGENWFFYWKTSSSLWETKLRQVSGNKVIVPINWSFHSETGDFTDFAEKRPETDLKALYDLAQNLGKEMLFLVPLSPMPFLTNGGVPHLLARNLALDHYGMAYSISDGRESFNKLYSFFDTRIFKSYGKFISDLGRYFDKSSIAGDVYGLESGYIENGYFKSYFYDNSRIFTNAFSNFLKAKLEQGNDHYDDGLNDNTSFISDPAQENDLKNEFRETISSFYLKTAKKGIKNNWAGDLKVSFIGGQNKDFINKIYGKERIVDYLEGFFHSVTNDILPSSVLIDGKKKEKVFGRVIEDYITNSYSSQKFTEAIFEEIESNYFKPMFFFELLYNRPLCSISDTWSENYLLKYLAQDYKWAYRKRELSQCESLETLSVTYRFFFVLGESLSVKDFNHVLKIFLNGGKVILDTSLLSRDLTRRLSSFAIENSLDTEKINYVTEIGHTYLGEGRLVTFDGSKLKDEEPPRLINFWKKIISTFEIPHLKVSCPDDVEYGWRTRDSNSAELDFEEVRRISFYNPTSYKKKIKIFLQRNFALLKILDEVNTKIHTSNYEIEIEILPEGSLSLDFGIYS